MLKDRRKRKFTNIYIIGSCLLIVFPFKLLQTYEVSIVISNLQVTKSQVSGGIRIQIQVSLLPKSIHVSLKVKETGA